MSKFAKRPVEIVEGVKIEAINGNLKVTGPKGTLERKLPKEVSVEIKDNELMVKSTEKVETKFGRAILGTTRSHIQNMVTGVSTGWKKQLELVGTGYRGEVRGQDLVLTVGLTHTLTFNGGTEIKFLVEKNVVTLEGSNKDKVTQLAAKIRHSREPDPYKGKGIRYLGEYLKLKPGKQAAKTAA